MSAWPENGFGPNLAFDDISAMTRALGIRDGDRVLDVGGASNTFPRADVVCDLTFGETSQRNGSPGVFQRGVTYCEAPIDRLPFRDKEFDFVVCRQVLEHVPDPLAAAAELSRVARRGLVEVPSRVGEMLNGNPTHRWIVDREGDTLVFHRRRFIEHPFDNLFYGALFQDADLRLRADATFRNVQNHQVLFSDGLSVRVEPVAGPVFDYDDPAHAARSHYSFARNCLMRGAELTFAYPDAHLAVRFMPDRPEPRVLLAVYQARLLQFDDALATLGDLKDRAATALRRLVDRAMRGEPVDVRQFPVPGQLPADLGPIDERSDRPRVSLAVVAQGIEGLRTTVESALTQDYPDVHVVVVSTLDDAALEWALGDLRQIERLVILRAPHGTSPVDMLATGFVNCRGNVIGAVVAGDRLECHHVDRLVASLLASGADAVHGDRMLLDGSGVVGPDLVPGNPVSSAFSLSTMLFHSATLLRMGAPEPNTDEPIKRWLTRLVATQRVVHVPVVTVDSPHAPPSGRSVITGAQAEMRLAPLELYRELVGAYAREARLFEQLLALQRGRPPAEGSK